MLVAGRDPVAPVSGAAVHDVPVATTRPPGLLSHTFYWTQTATTCMCMHGGGHSTRWTPRSRTISHLPTPMVSRLETTRGRRLALTISSSHL